LVQVLERAGISLIAAEAVSRRKPASVSDRCASCGAADDLETLLQLAHRVAEREGVTPSRDAAARKLR